MRPARGGEQPAAAIILDTNNRMSIGRYQWQRESVIYYYKELYDVELNRVGAILIAVDEHLATELTRDVLFDIEDGWKNWWNCAKRESIPEQVKIINKLSV